MADGIEEHQQRLPTQQDNACRVIECSASGLASSSGFFLWTRFVLSHLCRDKNLPLPLQDEQLCLCMQKSHLKQPLTTRQYFMTYGRDIQKLLDSVFLVKGRTARHCCCNDRSSSWQRVLVVRHWCLSSIGVWPARCQGSIHHQVLLACLGLLFQMNDLASDRNSSKLLRIDCKLWVATRISTPPRWNVLSALRPEIEGHRIPSMLLPSCTDNFEWLVPECAD